MFDDPAGEVDELTGLIKQDIQVRLWGGKGGVVKCLRRRGWAALIQGLHGVLHVLLTLVHTV